MLKASVEQTIATCLAKCAQRCLVPVGTPKNGHPQYLFLSCGSRMRTCAAQPLSGWAAALTGPQQSASPAPGWLPATQRAQVVNYAAGWPASLPNSFMLSLSKMKMGLDLK